MEMKFSDKRILDFFLEKKVVVTQRNFAYKVGKVIEIEFDGNIVAKAKVGAVFLNVRKFRELLRKYSGFETVEEWEEKAKELHKGKLPKYIILLGLVEKYEKEKEIDLTKELNGLSKVDEERDELYALLEGD